MLLLLNVDHSVRSDGAGNGSSRGSDLLLLLLLRCYGSCRHEMGVGGSGAGDVSGVNDLHSRCRRRLSGGYGVQNRPLRRSHGRSDGQGGAGTTRWMRLLRRLRRRSLTGDPAAGVMEMGMVNGHQVRKHGRCQSLLLGLMNDLMLVRTSRRLRKWRAHGPGRSPADHTAGWVGRLRIRVHAGSGDRRNLLMLLLNSCSRRKRLS